MNPAKKAPPDADVTPPPGMRGKPPAFRKPPPAEAGAGDVTPKYAKGGAVGAPLADDEGRLARFGNLTAVEKARIRAQQQEELKSAESEKARPMPSKALDALTQAFGHPARKEGLAQAAREDTERRARRYQDAKARAEMSDDALSRENRLYGVDRKVKLKDNPIGMARGGAVGAKRGDGCCQRGYTKGKFV